MNDGGEVASSPAGDDRSQRERMLAGHWYSVAGDTELLSMMARAHRGLTRFTDTYREDPARAQLVLAELLGGLGPGAHVRAPLFLDYGCHLFVGAHTFINFQLTALDVAEIRIGSHCQIGPGVQLLTATHPIEPGPRRAGQEAARPITIADNVWVGGGAVVLPGTTIGADAVVGAGAVVTRDVAPGVVVAGNPARVLRRVDEGAS